MRRRGFSLVEMMAVLMVVGLLVGIAMVSFRSGTRTANTHSLATVVVAELEAARMRAMADHTFVALSFPSSGEGVCQSFSRWEGQSQAHYRKGRNFASEFPTCSLFVGSWSLSSGAFSIDRPATGTEMPGFDLAGWFAPSPVPTDNLLVFCPTGAVLSNDLPLLDGRYVLVVGASVTAEPGASPPGTATVSPRPPYFVLRAAESPQSIFLSPAGAVSLQSGLGKATGVQLTNSGAPSVSAAPLAAPGSGGNAAPVVENVTLSPGTPNLPGGLQGSISKDDYLRVTVEATDADGDPLTCTWSSNGGAFTSANSTRMTWDRSRRRWISAWTFRADPRDPPLTTYDLSCVVQDAAGNLATTAAGVQLVQKVELRLKPFLACTEWPLRGLYTVDEDGANLVQIPIGNLLPDFVSVHPDGHTIAFTETDYTNGVFQIWSVNRDGSNLRALSPPNGTMPAYSPDGKLLAFARGGTWHVMPACGEVDPTPQAATQLPPRPLPTPGVLTGWTNPCFSSDSKKLVFNGRSGGPPGDEALYVYHLEDDTWTRITPLIPRTPNGTMWQGVYSRNPAYPNLVLGRRFDGTNSEFFLVNDDGTNYRTLSIPFGAGYLHSPNMTRDGLGMVCYANNGAYRCDLDLGTATASNPKQIVDNSYDFRVRTW